MTNEPRELSPVDELEARHAEVMRQLDELEQRIDEVLKSVTGSDAPAC